MKLFTKFTGFRFISFYLIFMLVFISACVHSGSNKIITYDLSAPSDQQPRPWRGEQLLADPANFQFVIIADRTGGNRPGVFEQAIPKINWLQPEFVMSIGDLIDGYSEDLTLLETQWQNTLNIVAGLQMPFFFVPGNHDISNDLQLLEWHKRFGQPYYHFIYKNVLFLIIDTEDPAHASMSPEQTAYCLDVLYKYKNVRWTMVFMHEPLWQYGSNKGYLPVEAVLKKRPYTVFSGHYHQYLHSQKNGRDHYILATSGGVSQLRGSQFGEFDQLTWVTMTAQGPCIANLALNGILSADLVTDSTYAMAETLLDGTWINIKPAVSPTAELKEISTTIHFSNPAHYPLKIKSQLPDSNEIQFSPNPVELVLPAGNSIDLPFHFNLSRSILVEDIDQLPLSFSGSYLYPPDSTLSLPRTVKLLLDWQHVCPKALTVGDIDGKIDDWDNSLFISCRRPQALMEGWDWHGAQDGWFRFATVYDQENLYLAVEFLDDRTLVYPENPEQKQDRIYLELSPALTQLKPPATVTGRILKIQISAGQEAGKPFISDPSVKGALAVNPGRGLTAELAIPWKTLYQQEKLPGPAFRLNIGIMDDDNPAGTKASVLLWRPKWDSEQNYNGSGIFILK